MPLMNNNGKFILGDSLVHDDLAFHLPTKVFTEYNATAERKVYLFTASKITGRLYVIRKGLLEPSKLRHILTDNPALQNYQTAESNLSNTMGVLIDE